MRIAVAGGTGVVGRYVVTAAHAAGHETVVLSRAAGVDLQSDEEVATALQGVDAIIDASNATTLSKEKASAFFTDVTQRLHRLGTEAGVTHLVTLSIVGVDRVPGFGYYEAKMAHEAAAKAGPLPCSIVRATQFHEFAAQILGRMRLGRLAFVPRMKVRSVAARSVGLVLVDVASDPSKPPHLEVGGPGIADLVAQSRATVKRQGGHIVTVPLLVPGKGGHAMRTDALLPASDARIEGPTFAEWLKSDDATVVTI